MLYRTLKRMIERGQTAGIETKLDIFYAADKISESEYQELLGMLSPKPKLSKFACFEGGWMMAEEKKPTFVEVGDRLT